MPQDGPELGTSGLPPPPPPPPEAVAEPTIDDLYPDTGEDEPKETGPMAWLKREDLLTLPNWTWLALLLVIICGSCSSCCVMMMMR